MDNYIFNLSQTSFGHNNNVDASKIVLWPQVFFFWLKSSIIQSKVNELKEKARRSVPIKYWPLGK